MGGGGYIKRQDLSKSSCKKPDYQCSGKTRGVVNSPWRGWSCDGSFATFDYSVSVSLVFITAVMMLCAEARPTLA